MLWGHIVLCPRLTWKCLSSISSSLAVSLFSLLLCIVYLHSGCVRCVCLGYSGLWKQHKAAPHPGRFSLVSFCENPADHLIKVKPSETTKVIYAAGKCGDKLHTHICLYRNTWGYTINTHWGTHKSRSAWACEWSKVWQLRAACLPVCVMQAIAERERRRRWQQWQCFDCTSTAAPQQTFHQNTLKQHRQETDRAYGRTFYSLSDRYPGWHTRRTSEKKQPKTCTFQIAEIF